MAGETGKLQKAIFGHLSADAALTTLLGGAKIYDRPAESASLPYITFGITRVLDAGTASEEGQEHLMTLHAWSRKGGRKEAMSLMDGVQIRLQSLGPVHEGMRIILLRFRGQDRCRCHRRRHLRDSSLLPDH
jgi:hypothetical protein